MLKTLKHVLVFVFIILLLSFMYIQHTYATNEERRPKLEVTYTDVGCTLGNVLYHYTTVDNGDGTCTTTFQPDGAYGKDAQVIRNDKYPHSESTNYGDNTRFYVASWTINGNPVYGRSYLEFDLSYFESSSMIQNVQLSLYWHNLYTTSSAGYHGSGMPSRRAASSTYIRRVTSLWDESTITRNTQPTIITTNQVGIPAPATYTSNFEGIDVTQLAKDMVDNVNYGFQYILQTESIYRSVNSASSDIGNQVSTDIQIGGSGTGTVNENLAVGSLVGVLSTIDFNILDTHIYTFCGGADDTLFQISGTDLQTNSVFDFEVPIDSDTNGNYEVCIVATDSGTGNLPYEKTITITINDLDEIPPTTPVVAPDMTATTDLGTSSTDDITSDNTPDFDVVCTETGSIITLYTDNPLADTVIGTHTCVGLGTESLNVSTAIMDGVHNVIYSETDIAGNESGKSPSLTITIDITVPIITEITPVTPAISVNQNPSYTLNTNEAGDLSFVGGCQSVTSSAITGNNTVTLDGDGVGASLPGGIYNCVASVTDLAGNTGTLNMSQFIIDVTPPSVSSVSVNILDPNSIDNPEITFSAIDNIAVDYYTVTYNADDSGVGTGTQTIENPATSPFLPALDPDEVIHTIVVTVYDTAGNSSQSTIIFPPIVTITAPTTISNVTITNSTVTISTPSSNDITNIILIPGSTNATLGTCTGSGNDLTDTYAQPVTCLINNITASGTIIIDAKDAVNEAVGRNMQSYVIDTTYPVVIITAPTKLDNTAITDTTIIITDNEAIDATDVSISAINTVGVLTVSNLNCIQTTNTQVDCTLQIDDVEGIGDLQVDVSDIAGNTVITTEINYEIDKTPPIDPVCTTTPSQANDGTTVTTICTGVETGTTLTIQNMICTPSPADGTGIVNCTGIVGTNPGDVSVSDDTVTVTDQVGNDNTNETTGLTIDNTIPATPVTAPDLQPGSDTGSSSTDNLTNNTTPTFDIECTELGATITLYVYGLENGTHTCVGVGTESVTISKDLTLNAVYNITYTERDLAGNESGVSPILEITIDTTYPILILNTPSPYTMEVYDTYTEPGYTVTDNIDTSVAVVVTGTYNPNVDGTYTLTYTATDDAGNQTVETRIITVNKRTSPVGGGGGGTLSKDNCPNGDNSPSYYDNICGEPEDEETEEGQEEPNTGGQGGVCDSEDEFHQGYCFARRYDITTIDGYKLANPDELIPRKDLAKMMVNFAVNILGEDRPTIISNECKSYGDLHTVNEELTQYIYEACEMRIMGIHSQDQTPKGNFDPEQLVTRAEYGTVLSRVLRGDKYNGNNTSRYQAHLEALKNRGYMDYIHGERPSYQEIRKYVWVTLDRIYKDIVWDIFMDRDMIYNPPSFVQDEVEDIINLLILDKTPIDDDLLFGAIYVEDLYFNFTVEKSSLYNMKLYNIFSWYGLDREVDRYDLFKASGIVEEYTGTLDQNYHMKVFLIDKYDEVKIFYESR